MRLFFSALEPVAIQMGFAGGQPLTRMPKLSHAS